MLRRLTILLSEDERQALHTLAKTEVRYPADETQHIVRLELTHRGLLPVLEMREWGGENHDRDSHVEKGERGSLPNNIDGKLCTLRYSKIFEEQATKITDIRCIDEALLKLTEDIALNPDVFPCVPGFKNIQIAETDSYSRGDISVPPLRLWFKKIDANIIELLAIESYEKQNDE